MNRIIAMFFAVLVFSFGLADSKTVNFECTNGSCSCDPNNPGDCDAMKKNCLGGMILACSSTLPLHCSCISAKTTGRSLDKKLFKNKIQ